jgi:hypothetical protein
MSITFPLPPDFFEGGANVSGEKSPSLVDVLNQLAASSGLGNTQSEQAWDGAVLLFTLVEAGHDPGLYTLNASGTILSADGSGIVVIQTTWHDPDLGLVTKESDPIPNSTLQVLNPYTLTFFSDGLAPIVAHFEAFGTHPTAGISIYVAAARSG